MIFFIFSQLPESVFRLNFSGKHFPGNRVKFSFDFKVFSVDQFFNDKQIQESFESDFQKPLSRKQTWSKSIYFNIFYFKLIFF